MRPCVQFLLPRSLRAVESIGSPRLRPSSASLACPSFRSCSVPFKRQLHENLASILSREISRSADRPSVLRAVVFRTASNNYSAAAHVSHASSCEVILLVENFAPLERAVIQPAGKEKGISRSMDRGQCEAFSKGSVRSYD